MQNRNDKSEDELVDDSNIIAALCSTTLAIVLIVALGADYANCTARGGEYVPTLFWGECLK